MNTSTNTNTNTHTLKGYGTLTHPGLCWWLIPYIYVLKRLSVAYMDQIDGRVVSCKNWDMS